MDIYTFDKSLQERLVEYTDILSAQKKLIPASQIQSEWACHVELVLEPVGWQALWKIPRLVCEDFEIHYPTIVMIEVECVDFDELSALVKITAVQDDIHLPEKYDVALIELYPTINQKNTSLDLDGTANCIDQLRFFYNHIWMPWDIDEDDNVDWVDHHLETRIRLFFDTKRGAINKETCDIIRTLAREGRDIERKIRRLEATISDDEEIHDGIADETCQLMKLHFRLQQIKSEMEVLENPSMREMLARNHSSSLNAERKRSTSNKDKGNMGYFVWLGGTVKELQEASSKIVAMLPSDLPFKVCGYLEEALHASEMGDIILLGEGNHSIRGAGGLEEGGVIKGLYNTESTTICPKESEGTPALLDFNGSEVLLENICIDLGEVQAGIIARKGTVKIVGCKIRVSNQSTVKLGAVVLPGAKLIAENTVFEGLGTAVTIYATAEVFLNKCRFENCVEGIQLCDNARFTATKCYFENFKEYGIRMETQKYVTGAESKSGNSELLNGISEISVNECKFACNVKADVALKPKGVAALTERQDVTA